MTGEYASTSKAFWGIFSSQNDRPFGSADEIRSHLKCHPAIARVLWNRGIRSADLLKRFTKPDLADLPDPFTIVDMERAVERVADAIVSGEKLAVYGDYDVDGTCGISILVDFLRGLGVEPLAYQPNRFTEGYGVHSAAVEKLISSGARVVITVDCGITAVEPARLCQSRGVDMVILDHHKLGAELPPAFAVVDPQRPEDKSGLANLCGAGLAFFFAMALRSRLRTRGFFNESRREPNLMRLLDLVAIATVADVVDIRGINRILVTHGLRVMSQNPRIGVRALMEAARIETPSAMHCGFFLGPRINAAGRLKSAKAAFELLTSQDPDQARRLAQELEQINAARRQTQDDVLFQAREQAITQLADPVWNEFAEKLALEDPALGLSVRKGPWPRALILAAHEELNWHEGVVGIVASKIADEFGRPAFILAAKEGDVSVLKGSVRSFAKIDILNAISAKSVAAQLLNFGGHAHAGGVTLAREKLPAFREELNLVMASTTGEADFIRERRSDAELALTEIDSSLLEELESLEPFGHEFPEPVFKLENVSAREVQIMKEKHIKLRFAGAGAVEGVWFNAFRDEKVMRGMERLRAGKPCSLWVSPKWNEWQGVKRVQLQIRDAEL